MGSRIVDDSPSPRQETSEDGLVRFKDERHGLSISYPAIWRRIPSTDPEVSLVAGAAEASLLVRTARLGTPVKPGAINSAKALTERLVARGERVRQLRPPRQVDLGGLPGWLHIYSFEDPNSGQRGAHAHYFLFRGDTMITLVFQTVPSESFATYAPLFDRLEATFEADPAGKGS